jgi:AcrR family transcriptional regulator
VLSAQEAGVDISSLYRFFANKEAIITTLPLVRVV